MCQSARTHAPNMEWVDSCMIGTEARFRNRAWLALRGNAALGVQPTRLDMAEQPAPGGQPAPSLQLTRSYRGGTRTAGHGGMARAFSRLHGHRYSGVAECNRAAKEFQQNATAEELEEVRAKSEEMKLEGQLGLATAQRKRDMAREDARVLLSLIHI